MLHPYYTYFSILGSQFLGIFYIENHVTANRDSFIFPFQMVYLFLTALMRVSVLCWIGVVKEDILSLHTWINKSSLHTWINTYLLCITLLYIDGFSFLIFCWRFLCLCLWAILVCRFPVLKFLLSFISHFLLVFLTPGNHSNIFNNVYLFVYIIAKFILFYSVLQKW